MKEFLSNPLNYFLKNILSEWEATITKKEKRKTFFKLIHYLFFNDFMFSTNGKEVGIPSEDQYILEYVTTYGKKGKLYTQYEKLINLEVGDTIIKKKGPFIPYKKETD